MGLHWKYRETNDSEYATAFYAGLKIVVQDCDGDWSRWSITDPKIKTAFSGKPFEVASGDCHTGEYKTDPYHFNFAMDVAEHAARAIARSRRIAADKSANTTSLSPSPQPSGTANPVAAEGPTEAATGPLSEPKETT